MRLAICLAACMAAAIAADGPARAADSFRPLVLDHHPVKWMADADAAPVVTWAPAEAMAQFPQARNCRGLGPLDETLARNKIAPEAAETAISEAFAAWSAVAAIDFRRTTPDRAMILIGAETQPLGRAFTNVDYDRTQPGAGPRSITQALICLNPQTPWKVGFDGNLDTFDLRYTFMHEIGHAIGLDHAPARGALMDFRYSEKVDRLQPGDIAGAVALYGARDGATPPALVSAAGNAGDLALRRK